MVSIIMPAYNEARHISRSIDSVLGQTYPDWELLVLDDGSSDETPEIVKAYAQKDGRIRFYENEENMGVARTRNRGFDLAKGQWIALLDSDDIWHETKLEKQLELAEKTGADLIYCSYAMMEEKTGRRKKDYLVPETTDYKSLLKENVIGCSTVLLNRERLGEHRFDPSFFHEDFVLWLELLKSGWKAVGLQEVLTDYLVAENSRSLNKWNAAKNRWEILRKSQGLRLHRAVGAFCTYAVRGVIKHGG